MKRSFSFGFWVVIAALVVMALLSAFWTVGQFVTGSWQTKAQFGESFTFMNTLFSGWAFVAVVAMLYQLRKGMEEQRLQFGSLLRQQQLETLIQYEKDLVSRIALHREIASRRTQSDPADRQYLKSIEEEYAANRERIVNLLSEVKASLSPSGASAA